MLDTRNVIDKRLNVANTRYYDVLTSAKSLIWQVFTSNNVSNSSVNIQANPPSQAFILDPRVYIQVQFLITINGTAGGVSPNMLLVDVAGTNIIAYDAPRAFSLASVIKTLQVGFQNNTLSQNLNQFSQSVFPLFYADRSSLMNSDYSGEPTMPDQAQTYVETDLTARDPLGAYGSNSYWVTRAAFGNLTIVTNTPTQAQVRLFVSEPLLVSPFAFGPVHRAGFYGIDRFNLNIVWGDLSRIWSHSPAGNIVTSIAVQVEEAAARLGFLGAPDAVAAHMSGRLVVPYYGVAEYSTNTQTPIAPGASAVITVNAIQLNSVPVKMYIYARKADNLLTFQDSDSHFRINDINITYNGRTGLLASHRELDLYNITVKNGYSGSFTEWHDKIGSVLCLMWGEDVPLEDEWIAPGLNFLSTFSYQLNITNIHPSDSITPQLNTIVISGGAVEIDQGTVTISEGFLTPEQVEATRREPVWEDFMPSHDVIGGFSFKKLLDVGKRVVNIGRKVIEHPLASQIVSHIPKLGPKMSPFISKAAHISRAAREAGFGVSGGMPVRRRRLRSARRRYSRY